MPEPLEKLHIKNVDTGVGFAVLFNVPTHMLAVCGFTGAMGHMWRRALLANGAHPVVATFVGAMIVGILGYSQARFFHMPRVVFTVTGIIPMVPGVAAFETIVFFIRNDYVKGIESGLLAVMVIAAIGAGLVSARLLLTLGDVAYSQQPRGLWTRVTLGARARSGRD